MQRFFRVTPPAVHRMVLALERRGLLTRVAGEARSIRLLLPPVEIPKLSGHRRSALVDGRGQNVREVVQMLLEDGGPRLEELLDRG